MCKEGASLMDSLRVATNLRKCHEMRKTDGGLRSTWCYLVYFERKHLRTHYHSTHYISTGPPSFSSTSSIKQDMMLCISLFIILLIACLPTNINAKKGDFISQHDMRMEDFKIRRSEFCKKENYYSLKFTRLGHVIRVPDNIDTVSDNSRYNLYHT